MAFERESDMIAPLTESLPGLLLPHGPYAVACEVPDGARVVDIMYASMPRPGAGIAAAEPFARRLSRLSVAQTMVLALVWRERRISTSRLSSMTFIRPERLEADYLGPLEAMGLISRDCRSWMVGPWGEARPAQLIAIEAKLTDWRSALSQAEDNRTRADYSYVALPQVDARRDCAELWRSARERGVGVIELHPSGQARVALKARRAPEGVCRHKWQLSVRLLADALQPGSRWILFGQAAGI